MQRLVTRATEILDKEAYRSSRRMAEGVARETAEDQPSLVFMHAFVDDLAAHGDEAAQVSAEGAEVPNVRVDEEVPVAMRGHGDMWTADPDLPERLHRIGVLCADGCDAIELRVLPVTAIPKRPPAYALGQEWRRIGAWPERGGLATRLGPDVNSGEPS